MFDFLHKWRCNLARRRFEKSLDNVSKSEFERIVQFQRFIDSVRLVPGDKLTITFNEFFGVDIVDAETRSNPDLKEWKELNDVKL